MKIYLGLVLILWTVNAANANDSTGNVVIKELLIFRSKEKDTVPFATTREKFLSYKFTPLGIRYFNFGCVKTRKSGFWQGQIGKDKYGHAIFKEPVWGVRAFIELTLSYFKKNRNTPYAFISLYAPPDDCVGSIGKFPDCPYGKNPTRKYAEKLARALNISMDDPIPLFDANEMLNPNVLSVLFSSIATFELGRICQSGCILSDEVIRSAISKL